MNYEGIVISTPFKAIGDVVSITALPENIAKLTGLKVFYRDKRLWAFEHNPYIKFTSEPPSPKYLEWTVIQDARVKEQIERYVKERNSTVASSQTDFMLSQIGIQECILRHPRLYKFEDEITEQNKIVVHTTGSDRAKAGEPAIRTWLGEDKTRVMTESVMRIIRRNYKDWKIVQIGLKDDIQFPDADADMRGQLDLWATAREISSSARYIGVVSGPMHLANCFSKLEKRIVLCEFSPQFLSGARLKGHARPCELRNMMMSWLDPSNRYFNSTPFDIGFTFSISKI